MVEKGVELDAHKREGAALHPHLDRGDLFRIEFRIGVVPDAAAGDEGKNRVLETARGRGPQQSIRPEQVGRAEGRADHGTADAVLVVADARRESEEAQAQGVVDKKAPYLLKTGPGLVLARNSPIGLGPGTVVGDDGDILGHLGDGLGTAGGHLHHLGVVEVHGQLVGLGSLGNVGNRDAAEQGGARGAGPRAKQGYLAEGIIVYVPSLGGG